MTVSVDSDPDPYLRILQELSQSSPTRGTLVEIVDQLLAATDGERAFLFRVRGTGGFRVLVARHRDGQDVSDPSRRMSHYAISRMVAGGDVWGVADARQDRRYRPEDALDGSRLPRSIHVYPVRERGEIVGGVYIDHRFQEIDLERTDSTDSRLWVGLCALVMLLREQSARMRALDKLRAAGRGFDVVDRANVRRAPQADGREGSVDPDRHPDVFHGLESVNPDMLDLFDTARILGASEISVLIHGETGTGKGLLARAIHLSSRRVGGPFVTLGGALVPDTLVDSELLGHVRGAFTGADADRTGLLVEAHGGTFFLDEVADMSLDLQTKLLRVLEDGRVRPLGGKDVVEVDVRVIASTSRDLEALVSRGEFRRDLYYRLRAADLEILPLRERWEDVPALARSFLQRHSEREEPSRLSSEALARLMRYSWPGNVRELENEMRRLTALGVEEIVVDSLAPVFKSRGAAGADPRESSMRSLDDVVTTAERGAIESALRLCGGNKSLAARSLGITRKALYRRLVKYGLASARSGAPPHLDVQVTEDLEEDS